ncbi:hypothetical protein CCACVL1_30912, partial [Corchorus capsularis]
RHTPALSLGCISRPSEFECKWQLSTPELKGFSILALNGSGSQHPKFNLRNLGM